jgi:hypothetical protein
MSKIAEKKALEAYPIVYYLNGGGIDDANTSDRAVYEEGYDQAIQDFLEKAERWLEIHMPFGEVSHESVYDCIQGFKNYMQDE